MMLWLDVEGGNLIRAPNSPDLVPCDFWVFPIPKSRLAGIKFNDDEEMKWAVNVC